MNIIKNVYIIYLFNYRLTIMNSNRLIKCSQSNSHYPNKLSTNLIS